MSECKRLTDAEVKGRRVRAGAASLLREREQAAGELESDHDQAREDVKRLAQTVRDDAVTRSDGALCWCSGGVPSEACWDDPDGGSVFCRERRALLAEVDPK